MITVERASTASTPSQQAQRELVERVLASSAFVKSKRLSSLLVYLCDLGLSGRGGELNEQRVGEEVFGRPRGYDSMIDGIVRTQASRLRQKLDLYFSEEGANEPIRITVPRGSYVPVFEPHFEVPPISEEPSSHPLKTSVVSDETLAPVAEDSIVSAGLLRGSALPWAIAVVSLLTLIVVLALPRIRDKTGAAIVPAVPAHPLWSKIFQSGQSTLLVPGDSSLVIWQSIKNRNLGLDDYIQGSYRDFNANTLPSGETMPANLASRRYTSIVDLEIAGALGRIARDQGSALAVRYPRELRPNDLKKGNLVLVGAVEADPWITLFERDMDFTIENDRARHVFSVMNRNPRPEEPRSWDVETADPQHHVYAVVAWLPNLSGEGRVLLLEGTTMAGTECAWDFVADDSRLLNFLRRIRRPDGSLPYFEVVLGTNNISGSAGESTVLAYRVR